MAQARVRSFKRPRILVVILAVASALAVGAIAVQISRTGIDLFLVALLVAVVVLVERTVGDWFAELLGPGLATAVLTTCVGAIAWLLFSPGGTAERFLIAARIRGYDSLYYRLPNDADEAARAAAARESAAASSAGGGTSSAPASSPPPAATSGVALPAAEPRIPGRPVSAAPLAGVPVGSSSVGASPVGAPSGAASPVGASSVAASPVGGAPAAATSAVTSSPVPTAPPVAAAPVSRQRSPAAVSSSKFLDLKSILGQEDVPTSRMTLRVPAVAVTGEEIPIRVNVSSTGGPVVGHSIQITVDGRPLSTVVTGDDGVAQARFSSRVPGRYSIRAALPHAPSMKGSTASASVTILPGRD